MNDTSDRLPFVERMEPHNAFLARQDFRHRTQAESVGALASELAGAGWRILAVAGDAVAGDTYSAELRRSDKVETFSAGDPIPAIPESPCLMADPIGSQDHLAAASGGGVTVGSAGLRASLDQTRGWYLLTYQVARPLDGATHALEVRSRRPGIELSSNRTVAAATSEGQAEARLLRLLAESGQTGSADAGELAVETAVGPPRTGEGRRLGTEVDAEVRFGSLAEVSGRGGQPATLRISVAVEIGGARWR